MESGESLEEARTIQSQWRTQGAFERVLSLQEPIHLPQARETRRGEGSIEMVACQREGRRPNLARALQEWPLLLHELPNHQRMPHPILGHFTPRERERRSHLSPNRIHLPQRRKRTGQKAPRAEAVSKL